MTKEEMRTHHYNMWNNIVDKIIDTKHTVDIPDLKYQYCKLNCLLPRDTCFMCEYAHTVKLKDQGITCDYCPSKLEMHNYNHSCLSNIYQACILSKDASVQMLLAIAIRDSWKD